MATFAATIKAALRCLAAMNASHGVSPGCSRRTASYSCRMRAAARRTAGSLDAFTQPREPAPPSKIERPLHTPEGREGPELREFLRPPALP
jgi:hypothetical protein